VLAAERNILHITNSGIDGLRMIYIRVCGRTCGTWRSRDFIPCDILFCLDILYLSLRLPESIMSFSSKSDVAAGSKPPQY